MVDEAAAIVYERSPADGALRQGEILGGLLEPVAVAAPAEDGTVPFDIVEHPFTVIVSQACDLERDFEARNGGKPSGLLRSVLLCEAIPEDLFRGQVPSGSDIWKRIRQNKDERYMLLRAVPPELDATDQGCLALGLDFRRLFALRPEVVYEQLKSNARRRAVLRDLYGAHLNSRLSAYMARVGLPLDHDAP